MCKRLLNFEKDYQPTHVVAEITYGGHVHIVFKKEIDSDKFRRIIAGTLHGNLIWYGGPEEPIPFEADGSIREGF